MSKFNIGDKVMVKDNPYFNEEVGVVVGVYIREDASNKYLVKFNSLDMYEGWTYGYRFFINNPELNIEPYEGRAVWLEEEDLTKVEEECEEEKCEEGEVCMSKFNIGDKVISKGYPHLGEEVGVIVGIDTRENAFGKYLVKFDSLEISEGLSYRDFVNNIINNTYCITKPYEGYAIWLEEEDLTKVEEECEEEKCKEGDVFMSKFNIGDKVISKGYPHLGEEVGIVAGIDPRKDTGEGKYLVKFNSLDICSGWAYGIFRDDPNFIIEPYEGYAEWVNEDDLVKVEDECEKGVKSEFNVGDKVVAKDYPRIVKEVGVIVGIDTREDVPGKYLVKFDSLDGYNGWAYGVFINNPYYNIEPYEGRAIWLDDLIKVEEECEEECEEKCEDECEEDIRTKFESVRKQKEEIIKEKSKKVLELTLEIKEIEHEIEKIKKEWHL